MDELQNPIASNCSMQTDYGSTTVLTQQESVHQTDNISIVSGETAVMQSLDPIKSGSNISSIGTPQSKHQQSSKKRLFEKMTDAPTKRSSSPAHFTKMSVDMSPNSEKHKILERIEFILNILNQIFIGFVMIYMSWLCLHYRSATTALHAWLVTFGFVFLMAEAIMCHYSRNAFTFTFKRKTKTTLHWMLQILGGGLGASGALLKMIQKDFILSSIHAKLGFATFVLCLISLASGLLALFSIRLRNIINPAYTKTFHNLLGLTTFIMAMLAQFFGYKTGFFITKTECDFQSLMKVLTVLIMILTSIGPAKSLYHKCGNIWRHFKH